MAVIWGGTNDMEKIASRNNLKTYHKLCGMVNASGKDKIARKISDVVKKNVTRNKIKPIILKWQENHAEGSNGESEVKE
jgi:hypothetical protein